MNLIPRTLFGRNLWLIVALIVVGQLVNALAYGQFVARPRLKQSAEATARSLQAVVEGVRLLPDAERAGFVARFNARAGAGREPALPGRLTLMERGFLAELAVQLGVARGELQWRREAQGLIAVQWPGAPFWLVVPPVQPAHQFARTWLIASGVSALLALLGAWLIQRRINRPLARLVDAARALGEGRRRVVLPVDGPAETAALARGFNDMADALARDEEERLLMLAGLSHDLRTPLAKIRLASEMLRDAGRHDRDLLDTLDRSLHGLDGLLTQFLDYARAAHPAEQELPAADIELRQFLAETLALAPGMPQPRLLEGPAVQRRARPQALRRLVLNLVANAQNHGAPPLELACGADAQGAAWLEVRDRGPGIAPGRVDALKRPFQRGDAARGGAPGSGLGLAIVERIARAEGAQLTLLPRDGGGLVARVSWP